MQNFFRAGGGGGGGGGGRGKQRVLWEMCIWGMRPLEACYHITRLASKLGKQSSLQTVS